ncbi:hypothetical protein PoB_000167800 [Plakobranchus ocellatus]|uniref:Secreted protein n=1 Tax=Plakobranchus ocellatus TaxID=259542 RepID=A0AAV3XYV2_9GAST|nr:hypothetical protein PoB_000167800 [Plakobranchus ocellatus]
MKVIVFMGSTLWLECITPVHKAISGFYGRSCGQGVEVGRQVKRNLATSKFAAYFKVGFLGIVPPTPHRSRKSAAFKLERKPRRTEAANRTERCRPTRTADISKRRGGDRWDLVMRQQ